MRALEPVGTAVRRSGLTLRVPVARDLRINRHAAQAVLDGRGHRSLVGVLGFHLDLADSRRSAARKRTVRRSKALRTPVERGAVHARSAQSGLGARQRMPAARHIRGRAPGSSEAARASTQPEEDAGRVHREGGGSGQPAVKRAAHARWVHRQADRRGEIRVLFDKLGSHVLARRTSHEHLPAGSSARRTPGSGCTGSYAPCRGIAGARCAAPPPSIDSTRLWCGGG